MGRRPRKRLAGRPPHRPTPRNREAVMLLIGAGITEGAIAFTLGIDDKTLRKYYRAELDAGAGVANGHAARAVFKSFKRDWRAAAFWLARRAGWRETSHLDHTGAGGVTIEFVGAAPTIGAGGDGEGAGRPADGDANAGALPGGD